MEAVIVDLSPQRVTAMKHSTHPRLTPTLCLTTLLGSLLLTSCAPSFNATSEAPADAPMMTDNAATGEMAPAPTLQAEAVPPGQALADNPAPGAPEVPRSQPQLVKTANLWITVESVEDSLQQITAIARQYQGDILGLQNQTPPDNYSRHTATLTLRVPQAKLDATLNAVGALGEVQSQSLVAEDVSTQLVDYQARLRNLQKTEEMLLEIMDRSGDMADVLKVAQELSTIRSSIEQIDAQLKDLQNRVAYSTVNISLEGAIAPTPPQRPVENQLQETWKAATHSLGEFTTDLMQLGIWLLVYSPYLLILAGAVGLGYLKLKRSPSSATPVSDNHPTT